MQAQKITIALCVLLAGCAGTGPERSLETFFTQRGLPADSPVILVDLDDTVYERAEDRPLLGAADALKNLSRDHLVVYLTARPTYFKIPFLTHNRSDSEDFLASEGFPDGALFTSSLWNFLFHGQGGGKRESFRQVREFGIERIALAAGDRPHDLEVYLTNGHVQVDRAVIILIENDGEVDPDREALPGEIVSQHIAGDGAAWPRILGAYRNGGLDVGGSWIIAQPSEPLIAGQTR